MSVVPNLPAQRAERINRRAVVVLLGLCFVAGHAGGLGLAPLAAIAGVCGMVTSDYSQAKAQAAQILKTQWILALALFLGWSLLSALWSPYEPRGMNNALKLMLGAVFYEAGRRAFVRASGEARVFPLNSPQILMIYMPMIAAIILLIDIASGFGLSFAVDPPRPSEDIEKRRADAIMNTSNGLVFLTLMSVPSVILLLWTRFRGPIICVLLLALVGLTAVLSGLNVVIGAMIFSILCMLLAAFYPKATIGTLTGLAMMLVGFAPIVSALAMATSSGLRAAMPFSWEHRMVTWSYVGERIREHPIIGHGFDASRTFDAKFSTRGFDDMAVVSLHPHNAGLQIWLETGFIGAALGATLIYLLGQHALKFSLGGRARSMAAAGLIAPLILISSVSYGVWQDWWWACLFLCAGVLHLVPRTKFPSQA